jgi:O-antigen/teichoic acid export membrane protein
MFQTLAWLVLPIAYNRVKDAAQPLQLWSADRVILGAIGVYAAIGGAMLGFYWLWGGWLTTLLTQKAYEMSAYTTLLIALGRFLQCFALLVQVVFAVHQKMTASLLFRLAGAALTVPLCYVLIQKSQIDGAALGSAIAGFVYLLILALGPGGFVWLMLETRRQAIVAGRDASKLKDAADGF